MASVSRVAGWRAAVFVAAAGLMFPAICSADTLWIRTSATGKPIKYSDVRVEKIANVDGVEQLYFVTPAGIEGHRPLEQVVQIQSDDEPTLSVAENAFAKGDMKPAADAYRKLLKSSKPWVSRRADLRLVQSASKSGDFSDSVAAYITMSEKDAAGAANIKPSLADAKPEQIDAAIKQVQSAADSGPDAQRHVLLPFLAELYNAKKDTASAEKIVREMTQSPTVAKNADAQKAQADVALSQAREAFSQQKYAEVLKTLRTNSAAFGEPEQQDEALFLIAEAKAARAKDEQAMKDAALAYMRVVANFKSLPNAPHVAESLLKTAAIEEKLNRPKEALALYTQVAAEFKDSPAAKQAQENADRLGKK